MQYYNGSMYGCSGDSYQAGTVQGFVAQTNCLDKGLVIQGQTIRVPYDKQAPGLPAQAGAAWAATCHRAWFPRHTAASRR